jgi:hypothetical protein
MRLPGGTVTDLATAIDHDDVGRDDDRTDRHHAGGIQPPTAASARGGSTAKLCPGNSLDGAAIDLRNTAAHLGCPGRLGVSCTSVSRLSSNDPASAARASLGSANASLRISAGLRFIQEF